MRRWRWCALLCLPALCQAGDCFQDAARFHRVDADILRAIARVESAYDPAAVGHNSNGTQDLGLMQINSVHFAELASQGIAPKRLRDACTSIYVAAWHYARQVSRYGNTWKAVGAYHSATPALRDGYARRVRTVVEGWRRSGRVDAPRIEPLYAAGRSRLRRPDNFEFRWLDE